MTTPTQRSPLFAELERLGPTWQTVAGQRFAVHLAHGAQDESVVRQLAICDISGIPSWTVKGAGAERWLGKHDVHVPSQINSTFTEGCRVIRTGNDEFLVEQIPNSQSLTRVADWVIPAGKQTDDVMIYQRQDAVLMLIGVQARDVLSQTCGINWANVDDETLVMTRVAGVNCGIMHLPRHDCPRFQLRFDGTYAIYLWKQLVAICSELGGQVAGVELVCPEWFRDR